MGAIVNSAFLKIPQGLETQIRRYIITKMLMLHNQKRKKYTKQGYHPWLPDWYAKTCVTFVQSRTCHTGSGKKSESNGLLRR